MRKLLHLIACVAILLGTAHVAGWDVALALVPALVLSVPLYFGRYVGENRIAALRARGAPSVRVRRPVSVRWARVDAWLPAADVIARLPLRRGPPALTSAV